MNTIAFKTEPPESELVEFVDLKWLMACEGHRVDLSRLQCDAAYARHCIDLAMACRSPVLRELASRIALHLAA